MENGLLGHKLSEYYSGYRAFSRQVLEALHFDKKSDDFVFDNQILAQVIWADFSLGEGICPKKYFS